MTANPKQWRHDPKRLADLEWHQMSRAEKISARKFDLHPPKSLRDRHLRKTYNITEDDYNEILQIQDNKCAICEQEWQPRVHKYLHVDHCHRTGAIRGLLCARCNLLVGMIETTAPRASLNLITYLFPEYFDNASNR